MIIYFAMVSISLA